MNPVPMTWKSPIGSAQQKLFTVGRPCTEII